MYSDAELSVAYKFANAPLLDFPYPHFYVPDVFPADYYARLQANIPDPSLMTPIGEARPVKGYNERFVLDIAKPEGQALLPPHQREFWQEFSDWLCSDRFLSIVIAKFRPLIEHRFGKTPPPLYSDTLLVEDITKYALGPHTDAQKKVVTMLFYLPKDESQSHLGTSIYVPKNPRVRCKGGPHYPFEHFLRMQTMPFLPNALFGFFKTDNSFHGVEPVTDPDTKRWLLLYDIYARFPGTAGQAS